VDGISGATLTGKGVSAFLESWIKIYEPFFVKLHRG
jgi:Na+-transporting NADH:ubiquinone oxidoreductase subunit NqrC